MFRYLLVFFFFGLLCIDSINAQVIQLGTGTTTNGITTSSPVNTYYRRTVCQFVYTAAEINAAGGTGPNVLTQMGFYVTSNPLYTIPGYTIKLKHTTATNVNAALGTTGWTTVKNAFTYSPSPGGYDMLVFDTPFNWDGVSNIGVEICWSQVQPTWDASGQCRIYTAARGYRYSWDDNTGSICGTAPATRVNTKPQVQMTFKTTSTWTGNTSSDWFTASNWDAGVPDNEMHAFIPSVASNQPIINAAGAECKNLDIENGASLTLNGTNEVSIYGDWTNNGTFNANSGNVILTGTATNIINGATNQTLYDLTVSNVNGATVASGSINLYGSLNVGIAAGSFNTGNAITLISNASGTARIPELASLCLYTLDMSDSYGDSWNGGFITVYIDGIASGTYFAKGSNTLDTIPIGGGSTIELRYTAGSYENENTYTLYDPTGTAVFSDGPTPATGSVYTGTSTCAFFNPIAGNITMQRYIDAGETNWRFLTSPVSGAQLDDWNDDFTTSGIPGSDFPTWPTPSNPWPSIYFYDETASGVIDNGFDAASNMNNGIGIGQGVWVWSGDTSIGTQPFTIDVTGPPNAGSIALPVSYTNSGSSTDDGWSMVGNPYPCTIDWDDTDWTKTNINGSVYIWNPDLEQFATYVLGVGTNGGSRYIASSQAFWVQTNGASPVLQIEESCKIDADQAFIKQGIADQQLLRFEIQVGSKTDEAVLRFIDGATDLFDAQYDAVKMSSAADDVPYISLINNAEELAVNSYEKGTQVSIPINVTSSVGGIYQITFTKENLVDLSCAVLEDLETGIITDIIEQNNYTFYLNNTTSSPRFMLHIWNNKNKDVIEPSCFESNDAEIVANASGNGPWTYNWSANSGLITSNNTTLNTDALSNISAGTYYIEIVDQSTTCATTIDTIVIDNPLAITLNASSTMPSSAGASDGTITLNIDGGTKPYTVNWSNGAITESISDLSSGIYEATVIDANGCETIETFVLDFTTGISNVNFVNGVQIYPNPAKNNLSVELKEFKGVFFELYDISGKKVLNQELLSTKHSINLAEFNSGIYFYKLLNTTNQSLVKGKLMVIK